MKTKTESDPAEILETVARHYHVDVRAIRSKDRTMHVTAARQIAMYLARDMSGASLHEIGKVFARDHSTVVHSVQVIRSRVESEPRFAQQVDVIRAVILGTYRPTAAQAAARAQEAA